MDSQIIKIEKTDDLSKWREKINLVFSKIKDALPLPPKDKKSILVANGEEIVWEDMPKEKEEEKLENLTIPGLLSATHISVKEIAVFQSNIETNNSVISSSLILKTNPIIKFIYNNYKSSIKLTDKGLKIDEIIINKSALSLEELIIKHCHILANNSSLIFTGNNVTPLSINFTDNIVYCNGKLLTPQLNFDKSSYINASYYTGNSESANKLKNSVKIYGNAFNGISNVTGVISDCTGIKFATNDSFIEFPSSENSPNLLQVKNGVLTYTGEFIPKKLNVKSEHYAEYYPSNVELEKGDVISMDLNAKVETYVKVKKSIGHPLGVVTDDYAMVLGEKKSNSYPVCNRGRVYAKVMGSVEKGDNLAVALIDGVLRKLQPKEKLTDTFAIALESSDNEDIKLVKVHLL